MKNIFDSALSPFYGFDMAQLYSKYGQIIDGFIFFPIFFGLTHFVFGKKYPGKSGKNISVALALMLTIAILTLENKLNFSIKSFGGLAIALILLMTGYFMITLAKSIGMKPISAFCLIYSIMYLSIATAIPNLFDYISTRAAWLNGILGIIFIITFLLSIYNVFRYIFSRKSNLPKDIQAFNSSNANKESKSEDNELKSIKQSRLHVKTITDMMDALVNIERIIKKGNLDDGSISKVKGYLHDMSTKESIFTQKYNQLILNFKRTGMVDTDRLTRLETELQEAPNNKKNIKQAEIDIEKRKIEYDRLIIEAKSTLDGYLKSFNISMQKVMHTLSDDDIHQAKKILLDLKRHCDQIDHMTKEVIDLNKMQKGLFKSEYKKTY